MLKVNKIFESVSGEIGGVPQGTPTTFVRFDGCNLRCSYCDTARTQVGNNHVEVTVAGLLEEILSHKSNHVVLTGGEPLMQPQPELRELVLALVSEKKIVSVETNGTMLAEFPLREAVSFWVVDRKLPGAGVDVTGESLTIQQIRKAFPKGKNTAVKYVCRSLGDLTIALGEIIACRGLYGARMAMSACPPLDHKQVFDAIMEAGAVETVLNVQLHKLIKFE